MAPRGRYGCEEDRRALEALPQNRAQARGRQEGNARRPSLYVRNVSFSSMSWFSSVFTWCNGPRNAWGDDTDTGTVDGKYSSPPQPAPLPQIYMLLVSNMSWFLSICFTWGQHTAHCVGRRHRHGYRRRKIFFPPNQAPPPRISMLLSGEAERRGRQLPGSPWPSTLKLGRGAAGPVLGGKNIFRLPLAMLVSPTSARPSLTSSVAQRRRSERTRGEPAQS